MFSLVTLGWQVSAAQHFPLLDSDWKTDFCHRLVQGHLASLLFVLPHSPAMVGGGRPPYFWAENDGKKKERATRRTENGEGER